MSEASAGYAWPCISPTLLLGTLFLVSLCTHILPYPMYPVREIAAHTLARWVLNLYSHPHVD